jgi:hypothetical protein
MKPSPRPLPLCFEPHRAVYSVRASDFPLAEPDRRAIGRRRVRGGGPGRELMRPRPG